jgi:hypothetical protein
MASSSSSSGGGALSSYAAAIASGGHAPPRRSARHAATTDVRPDDVLVGALAFLGAAALVTASGVCRRWRSLLDEHPAAWEGALFELDPCAVLGPAGFAAALGTGKTPLRVVHALGDSRCGKCGRRGARFYAPVAARRACSSKCVPAGDMTAKTLINRFFFLRADEPGAMRVSTRDELLAAVAMVLLLESWLFHRHAVY